jgi:hypothetical protein
MSIFTRRQKKQVWIKQQTDSGIKDIFYDETQKPRINRTLRQGGKTQLSFLKFAFGQ